MEPYADVPVTTKYFYDGTRLVYEKRDRSSGSDENIWYYYDAAGNVVGFELNNAEYYYVKNLQGDVIEIVDKNGTSVVEYYYDAWGNLVNTTGSLKDTVGKANLIRYRSYYFDDDMGFYYLNSRYYDPVTGRFISPDTTDVLTATPMALTDKNLYAYCDNNPVVRVDHGGEFWDTILDVVSLVASVTEVIVNPTSGAAWAGLVADVVCTVVPGLTGGGAIVKAVTKADDVVDTAKTIYKAADKASDIRKATGSYEIMYKSGKNYVGKGGYKRAITSASKTRRTNGMVDEVTSISWKNAPNSRTAFMDEYLMQKSRGVLSFDRNANTYNKIWSPGRNYYYQRYGWY